MRKFPDLSSNQATAVLQYTTLLSGAMSGLIAAGCWPSAVKAMSATGEELAAMAEQIDRELTALILFAEDAADKAFEEVGASDDLV